MPAKKTAKKAAAKATAGSTKPKPKKKTELMPNAFTLPLPQPLPASCRSQQNPQRRLWWAAAAEERARVGNADLDVRREDECIVPRVAGVFERTEAGADDPLHVTLLE